MKKAEENFKLNNYEKIMNGNYGMADFRVQLEMLIWRAFIAKYKVNIKD